MPEAEGQHQRLVAILAADAAGYSRLMAIDAHATVEALDTARQLFRSAIESHQGRVIDMAGDSVLAVFEAAIGAVSAALEVQPRLEAVAAAQPDERRMRFRIGVHLGDVIEKPDGSVYGDGVNITARLQAVAAPGGICLSDAVHEAVRHRVAAAFADEGEQEFKNVAQPVRVLRWVVPNEPSPPRVAGAKPSALRHTNLPVLDEPLVGRAADVVALTRLVSEHRLVTVLGAGGIGKTRLAQAVARQLASIHLNVVWWVDLGPLSSAEKIAPAIANAACLQLGDGDAAELLPRALEHRRTLLVLDNCEHLVNAVAPLVHNLLTTAPGVQVLATSQAALNTHREHLYRLEGLSWPPAGTAIDAARGFGALQLLEKRAQAVDRHFQLTEANLGDAIDLCRRLDGIPLAIEMVAARLPLLSLAAIGLRLDERLRFLHGAGREAPARQQALRATLDWSHALLNAAEQAALRRLSVFVGNFRVETAQHVAAASELDEWAALDALAALVNKSLVHVSPLEPRRYRLLETTRLYAAERLVAAGELRATEQRHGQAMARLAEEMERRFWTTPDAPWIRQYEADYDDLQAAFDRACDRCDAEAAGVTGNALLHLDHLRSVNAALRSRAMAAFALIPIAGSGAVPWLWNCVATRGLIAIATVPRLTAAREAVASWRQLGRAQELFVALGDFAFESAKAGDFAASEAALAEASRIEDAGWPARVRMRGAANVAGVAIYRKDAVAYRQASRRELAFAVEAGADRAAAWARLKLADAALMAGDRDEAIALGMEAVTELDALDQPSNLGLALSNLCAAYLLADRLSEARSAAVRAFPLMWQNEWGYLVLDQMALLAARSGHCEASARILGFADAWYAANKEPRQPNEAAMSRLAADLIDSVLGADQHARLRAEGTGMAKGRAETLVLAMLAASG